MKIFSFKAPAAGYSIDPNSTFSFVAELPVLDDGHEIAVAHFSDLGYEANLSDALVDDLENRRLHYEFERNGDSLALSAICIQRSAS